MGEKDKTQALHDFWSSFGWLAIDEQIAFDEGVMEEWGNPNKYITYEAATGSLGDSIPLTASLWHRSTSWATVEAMVKTISGAIGLGGKVINITGGKLWILRRDPFSRRMSDEDKNDMRRIIINITAEYLTAD